MGIGLDSGEQNLPGTAVIAKGTIAEIPKVYPIIDPSQKEKGRPYPYFPLPREAISLVLESPAHSDSEPTPPPADAIEAARLVGAAYVESLKHKSLPDDIAVTGNVDLRTLEDRQGFYVDFKMVNTGSKVPIEYHHARISFDDPAIEPNQSDFQGLKPNRDERTMIVIGKRLDNTMQIVGSLDELKTDYGKEVNLKTQLLSPNGYTRLGIIYCH